MSRGEYSESSIITDSLKHMQVDVQTRSMRFRLLGSGVNRPIEQRYLTSVYIQYENKRYLFDAPENVQVLIQRYGESMNLDAIFLTDLGPDTTMGLPGLLTTINFLSQENPSLRNLDLYLPANAGAKKRMERLLSLSTLNPELNYVKPDQTVIDGEGHSVQTFETDRHHEGTSLGYRVGESQRRGRFNRERAEELGVPVGPKFGKLHRGEPVELEDGRTILPDEVVGDPRPGRSIIYTGATGLLDEIPDALRDSDVAILDGGSNGEQSEKFRDKHMTAYDAGTMAGAAGASLLVVTHIRHVFNQSVNSIVGEITDSFDGPYLVGEDGVTGVIQVKESHNSSVSHVSDVLSELSGYSRMADF